MSWSICKCAQAGIAGAGGPCCLFRSQLPGWNCSWDTVEGGREAFASVYYNNADKEIQFHWYRLKVQYSQRFMASGRSVKNLKMIPPQFQPHTKATSDLSSLLFFFLFYFCRFCFGCLGWLFSASGPKDSCSWPRYTTKLSNTRTYIFIFYVCRCRYKDTIIQRC